MRPGRAVRAPRRAWLWLAAAVLASGVAATAMTHAGGPRDPRPDGGAGIGAGGVEVGHDHAGHTATGHRLPALVYLSGLDDHLLPERDAVPLHDRPQGQVTGYAPVDSLAWASQRSGAWLAIALADRDAVRGWVADYHLRHELHLVDPATPGCPVPAADDPGPPGDLRLPPSTRVQLVDLARLESGSWVLVRDLPGGHHWWIDPRHLSERAGPDIRRAPDDACEEVTVAPVTPHRHGPPQSRGAAANR